MTKKAKNKFPVLVSLVSVIILYAYVNFSWGKCPVIDCSESYIDSWLRTLNVGSLFLIGYFSVALFLPSNYFKTWLKYIFSWGFPMVVYLTYITTGSGSIPAYGKVDVVKFWGVFFAIVSVIFITFQYFRARKIK